MTLSGIGRLRAGDSREITQIPQISKGVPPFLLNNNAEKATEGADRHGNAIPEY